MFHFTVLANNNCSNFNRFIITRPVLITRTTKTSILQKFIVTVIPTKVLNEFSFRLIFRSLGFIGGRIFLHVFDFFIDLLEISVACLAASGTLAIWIISRYIYIVDKVHFLAGQMFPLCTFFVCHLSSHKI